MGTEISKDNLDSASLNVPETLKRPYSLDNYKP